MKIFCNILFFYFILFFNKLLEYHCQDNFQENNNNIEIEDILGTERQLNINDGICNIKNCLTCDNRNECIKCKEGYELSHKRCYTKNCEIYGFCKFCDEYDCLKCIKGYKLNYGICDTKEKSRKKFYLLLFITTAIIILIIYLLCFYKKLIKEKISTGKVIKFIHPKSGFYQLHYEVNDDPNQDISKNKIFQNSNSENELEKATPEVNCCVACGNKNTYCISDCGCSLCLEHYKMIKSGKHLKCRIHNTIMVSKISFVMIEKSNIRGNALEKLGLPKCPICKLNDGTQSFNCGCPMRVCEKCFNDNVYVLKYNQCPGCGMPYNPIKKERKRNKSSEESIKKGKIMKE